MSILYEVDGEMTPEGLLEDLDCSAEEILLEEENLSKEVVELLQKVQYLADMVNGGQDE
jgi:hypothetical protein